MDELRALARLAWPAVVGQLGTMAMGVVDLWAVGALGKEATAAVGIGNTLSFGVLVIGFGAVAGADGAVAQAWGAGRPGDAGTHSARAAVVAACYAPDATFSDPVFPQLDGAGAGAMWRMLCERGADLVVTHRIESEDGDRVVVRWDADYTFSTTGKKVHNEITATLVVRGEHIVAHTDVFDFWRWSRQALGVTGWLLGWSGSLPGHGVHLFGSHAFLGPSISQVWSGSVQVTPAAASSWTSPT